MRLSFRLVVRNGIRRFQIADPSNDPASLVRLARMVREAGVGGGGGRADLLDQPRAHARLLRGAGRRRGRLARHRPPLPEGPRRPAHRRRGARAGAEVHRRDRPATGRAAQPLHDRAGPAGLRRGAARGHPDAAHGRRSGRRAAHPTRRPRRPCATSRRRASRTASTSKRSPRCRSTSARSPATAGCRSARRPSTTPPTTATRCPAAWSPPRAACSPRWAAPTCFDAVARGGHARARRDGLPDHGHAGLAVRGHPGHDERVSAASAGATCPTRWCATSSATSTSPPRRSTPRWRTGSCRCRARTSCATCEPISLEGARERFGARHLGGGAAAAADDAGGAGRRDGRGSREAAPRPARAPRARPARAAAERAGQARVDLLHAAGEGRRPGGVAPCVLTTCAASCSTWTARSSTAARTSERGRCPAPSRCWRRSAPPAGRSCCSRTAATWRPRPSPPGCARTACRSATTRC